MSNDGWINAGCSAVREDGRRLGGGSGHPGGEHVLSGRQRQADHASFCNGAGHPTCKECPHPTHQVRLYNCTASQYKRKPDILM